MLNVYTAHAGALIHAQASAGEPPAEGIIWFDLLNPTSQEEAWVEAQLGVDVPTREEMEEIEHSSRLYRRDEALYMTATVIAGSQTMQPESVPLTFLLSGACLVTVRYAELQPFRNVETRLSRHRPGTTLDGEATLLILLDAIIDRVADLLEAVGHEVDVMSQEIFRTDRSRSADTDFQAMICRIGRNNDLTSRARESIMTMTRLFGFLSSMGDYSEGESALRLGMLHRDAASLSDHAAFLSNKLTFLLDASLGMINIEQNAIIKIFSVAAVVLLPPTLIASIYGMNFRVMPELEWSFGYPFAIALMLISIGLTYAYFKRRRWL